jgi:hypothetical protein
MEKDQQVQLTEEVKDQGDLLMIGGIQLFLPCAQEEAKGCIAGAATAEEQSPLMMTVEKELEQTSKSAQAEMKEEGEHSEEWLISFSQEVESAVALELTVEEDGESEHSEKCFNIFSLGAEKKEAVALELATKEAKERADRIITPWEMELKMLEDWLNNPGPVIGLTKFELSGRTTEQQGSQEGTAELKSAAKWQLEGHGRS